MSAVLTYLPMLVGAGAMAFMFSGRSGDPVAIAVGAMYALSMFGMMLSQMSRRSGEKSQKVDAERRDYLRYLAQVRRDVHRSADSQRKAMRGHHPDPDTLGNTLATDRLWERRSSDEDFGDVRVSVGPAEPWLTLSPPQTKIMEDLEPVSAAALRRFLVTYQTVPATPLSLNLTAHARIRFAGDPYAIRDLARAIVAQLTTFHSHRDLKLIVSVAADPERRCHWEWTKWLPHTIVVDDLAALETQVPDIDDRPRFGNSAEHPSPHYVVVVDGTDRPDAPLHDEDLAGVTVLDLDGRTELDRMGATADLILGDGGLTVASSVHGVRQYGVPDALSIVEAEAFARRLAPLRLPDAGMTDAVAKGEGDLARELGIADVGRLDTTTTWRPRPRRDRLRVPFGLDPDGRPVDLDLKDWSEERGDGPHGLVIGGTGSGKSELLRTLLLGIAMTHSSDTVNFVLVDFKGGATFAGLGALPHTSAVITNLEGDLGMVDRMRDAIEGEVSRRLSFLADRGNYKNLAEYRHAREEGADLSAEANLLLVIDEFNGLIEARPEFRETFAKIGQIGRSLGIHLLLSTQRVDESKLRGIEEHLSYRIGLHTFSEADSRAVIRAPDAFHLPDEPGHGYLRVLQKDLVRFRAYYVSGPYDGDRPTAVPVHDTAEATTRRPAEVTAFTLDARKPTLPETPAALPEAKPAERTTGPKVIDIAISRLMGRGPDAHRVWLPPLDDPPTLDGLLPGLDIHAGRGLLAESSLQGRLVVPIGLVDEPARQAQSPYWIDLSAAGGHVAVVGGPQSGKSTLLRVFVGSLALTHTPAEVQFYCLDLTGGGFGPLAALPHVGGIANARHPEQIRRTIAQVKSVIKQRQALFDALAMDSMPAYRAHRLRRASSDAPDPALADPYGDVFLIIDGWEQLAQQPGELQEQVRGIITDGLRSGVHVILSAQRWMELKQAVKEPIATRIELKLGDATMSEIDRRRAEAVPLDTPGRGITDDKLHFRAALPRMDGERHPASAAAGLQDLIQRIRDAWEGPSAPPVRLLPTLLALEELDELAESASGSEPGAGLAIGQDEDELAVVRFDSALDGHLVVLGDAGCGKTNLLRLIARQIERTCEPKKSQIVLVDYRHRMLDLTHSPYVLARATNAEQVGEIVGKLTPQLKGRMPSASLTAEQLRAGRWWTGPELFFLIDDYELVTTGDNPLAPLQPTLQLAREIGLHFVITRNIGGLHSLDAAILQPIRMSRSPFLIMSGTKDDGRIISSVTPEPLPPGRGRLVSRVGTQLIQTALVEH